MSEVYIFRVAYNICDGDTETINVAATDVQRGVATAMVALERDYYSEEINITAIEQLFKLDEIDKEWLKHE